MIWLDADTLIREKSGGEKSLDDFCRNFYGGSDSPPEVRPYTFDDIVAALNGVLPYDWKGFLEKRLTATEPEPPLDGLTRGGWKLGYAKEQSELLKANDYKVVKPYGLTCAMLSPNSLNFIRDGLNRKEYHAAIHMALEKAIELTRSPEATAAVEFITRPNCMRPTT